MVNPVSVPVICGSSPRLRGTDGQSGKCSGHLRFIPAPAGNSVVALAQTIMRSVHPRACGEQHLEMATRSVSIGSSPRLRGTANDGGCWFEVNRFIPAPAGNSSKRIGPRRPSTVHPRACGEQVMNTRWPSSTVGSSPRLRGTADSPVAFIPSGRFIPAPAGNSHYLGRG